MKRITIMLFAFWQFALTAMAQKEEPLYPNTLEKVEEGRLLALLDYIHLLAYPHFINTPQCHDQRMMFFPYMDGDTGRLIVYTRTLQPKVTYSVAIAHLTTKFPVIKIDAQVRDFTSTEWELYSMIQTTLLEYWKEDFFQFTPNTFPRFRPIITPKAHKLYYYSDPVNHDSIVFGNDYVVNFDQHNKFISKKSLHNHVSYYAIKDKSFPDTVLGYHSHTDEEDDDFTATDICKVIYHQTIAGWKNFVVEGKHFVTFWDYKKKKLIRYDAREFIDHYTDKPYRGRHLITHVAEETEDSGHIPITKQMEQIVDDGMYLTNLNIVNTFATNFAAKNAGFAKQNLLSLSYLDGHIAKTVFFKEKNFRKASATVSYDERYDSTHVKVDYQTRKFTANEVTLCNMYATALKVILDHHLLEADTTVQFIIQPVISGSSKKVYVSTESFDRKNCHLDKIFT